MPATRTLLLLSMTVQGAVALTFALVFFGLWRGFHRPMAVRSAIAWSVYALGVVFTAAGLAFGFGADAAPLTRALLQLPLQIGVVLFRMGTDSIEGADFRIRRYVTASLVVAAIFVTFREVETLGLLPPTFVPFMLPRIVMGFSYAWAAWPLAVRKRERTSGSALMLAALAGLSVRMFGSVGYEAWQVAHGAANSPESPFLTIVQVCLLGVFGVAASLELVDVERQEAVRSTETIRQAEHALRAAQVRTQIVFDAAPNGLVMVDRAGRIQLMNSQFESLFGYRREQLLGEPIERLLPAALGAAHREMRMQFFEAPATRQMGVGRHLVGRRQDGSEFPLEIGLSAVAMEDATFVVAAVIDITERRRAEGALASHFEFLPQSVMWSDDHDRVEYINRQMTETFGYALEDLPTLEAFFDLAIPEPLRREPVRQLWQAQVAHASETDSASGSAEIELRCKNGSLKTVAVSGRIIGSRLVVVFEDLTERIAIEAQLRQSQKVESLGRLAGGVAHDFNNLLTVINGYGDAVLGTLADGDPLLKPIAAIRNAGERAAALARQLLAVSRAQVVDRHPLSVNNLLSESRELFQRMVGEDIVIELSLDASGTILADAGQIHQVIMNLVVNARESMPRGGVVAIATANVDLSEGHAGTAGGLPPGRYLRVTVTDSGVGVPPEIQSRIFDPFFTTKSMGEGTGLGLSIVDGIVRQSGGAIAVSSTRGRGTVFTIDFPRLADGVGDDAPVVAPSAQPRRGDETVLVAEDEPLVRELVVDTLSNAGYHVLQAGGGAEGLEIAAHHEGAIHLLLTDIVMPGMMGPELAERLTASRPGTKVLYMSGYSASAITGRQLVASDVGYLAKPFATAALVQKVRALLDEPGRILLVDDDASVRGFLETVLTGAGYGVRCAAHGKQALALARQSEFDAVVTDLVMPEHEGIDLVRTLRADHPKIGIVAISGAFDGRFLPMAKSLGADATLAKPFSPAQLLATVKDVLAARSGR